MAGIQDQFPFLPGHLVEFKDGGMKIKVDPNPPSTESILILGTAVDGPINMPVAVDPQTADMIFGRAANSNGQPNGSTLMVGFEEAYKAGCRDIRLMRVSGEKATGKLVANAQATGLIKVAEEDFGPADGNAETTLTLANKNVVDGSVKVYAKGYELPSTAFATVTEVDGTEKVVIAANVTDMLADVTVIYSYTADSNTYEARETGTLVDGKIVPFLTAGTDKALTLQFAAESLVVTADGNPIAADKLVVAGARVTVKAGAAPMGALLAVSYTFVDTSVVTPEIGVESVFGGNVYNDVKVRVENVTASNGTVIGKKVVIVKPNAKKGSMSEKPLEFSSLDFPTFLDLVEAVNAEGMNNVVRMVVAKDFEEIATGNLAVTPEFKLFGGNDGIKLTKEQLFEKLAGKRDVSGGLLKPGAFHLLENYAVDYVVPMGVYANDKLIGGKDFGYELALACAVMSHRTHVTHGVIATTSPNLPTLEEIDAHVEALVNGAKFYFMKNAAGEVIQDAEGNKIDLGMYLTVLAAPDVRLSNSRFGTYSANSAAVYAALVSTLPVRSSPMNKEVPGILGLRYGYSNAHVNKLLSMGYTTYETKANGTRVVVADAPTAAESTSDYSQLTSFRAVKAAADEVRSACEPFLGEANDVASRNSMSSAIDKRLSGMKAAGAIGGYEFRIVSTLADQILGKSKIELTIVPPMILKKITTIVSLTPAL